MKRILLLCAVAVLAASCNNTPGTPAAADSTAVNKISTGAIAFVRIDSLINGYDMYLDLRSTYEAKAQKADNELTSKGRSLEREIRDFQEKIQNGLVTRAQAQTMEEELGRKQQNFAQQRDRLLGELGEEEQVMMNQIQFSIIKYLEEFNSDYRYDVILSTSGATPILSGNPDLDITGVVLDALNKKYAAEKPKTKPAADGK